MGSDPAKRVVWVLPLRDMEQRCAPTGCVVGHEETSSLRRKTFAGFHARESVAHAPAEQNDILRCTHAT